MNFIRAEGITKTYGEKELFRNLDFGIEEGDKIALVAKNGAGKTTLLNVLTGLDGVDKGKITVHKSIKIGFLQQEQLMDNRLTILEYLFSQQTQEVLAIKNFEVTTELATENPNDENLNKLQLASSKMDELKCWDYEAKVKMILSKLEISHLTQTIATLSGGQRKRVALAHILIEEPELLILDEPTNHLDIEMVEWLENYLAKPGVTCLLVTHDRYFLDRVTTEIVELDDNKLFRYRGSYQNFIEKKANREFNEQRETDKARNLLRKELEWMRKMPKARTTKSKSRIDAFYDLKEKAAGSKEDEGLQFGIKMNRIGGKILELKKVYKSYNDLEILKGFDYTFKKGERIGVIGKNGVGKTTFLDMLTGKVHQDSGKINTGDTIIFGYYNQKGLEWKEDKRLIDVVKDIAEVIELADGTKVMVSKFLEMFGFPPYQHFTFVSRLSGGEKRRLYLLTILVKNPNFLILDEPTNDLDLLTMQTLEEFLIHFTGCLILVSHDRYFMDKLVDHLFVFEGNGVVSDFNGNYTEYRNSQIEEEEKKRNDKQSKAGVSATSIKKTGFKHKHEFEKLEREIAKLEMEKRTIEQNIADGNPGIEKLNEWSKQFALINKMLDEKSERWLLLSEEMENSI